MSQIFRPEAVEAHLQKHEPDLAPMRVSPPWTWAVSVSLLGMLGVVFLWSLVGTLPVIERGRAVILPGGGARPLVAQAGGTIQRVHVRSGDHVEAGQAILEIESPSVEGPALVALREKELLKGDYADYAKHEDRLANEQASMLEKRIKEARHQLRSLEQSLERQNQKVLAAEKLHKEGLLSSFQVEDVREEVANVQRNLAGARQALVTAFQERASLESQRRDRMLSMARDSSRVDATAEGQDLARRSAIVRAGTAGRVDGLIGQPGDSVIAGSEVGRIMPDGTLEVVAFVSERYRAFLKDGGEAFVEIDQLPYGEFGSAKARIRRLGIGTASAKEVQATLGSTNEEGSLVRVDLELLDDRPAKRANVAIQPGMLADVRFVVRRQRAIARFIAPLRRLLD